ncbi:uncharacterized protein LOC127291530 [Leptopilina boulardi]|uniref:uncharacterized protein LOC127280411 n=1 Tax=Leptopilina boulardi TaxID=63433 RepID=UPI0021F54DA8|nr:uncharacterized protein LOC127280411 [Leptopilina boulardi]XP_051176675.1 uncharacterized protein LOC127291530 [Leptopilina boulardi]
MVGKRGPYKKYLLQGDIQEIPESTHRYRQRKKKARIDNESFKMNGSSDDEDDNFEVIDVDTYSRNLKDSPKVHSLSIKNNVEIQSSETNCMEIKAASLKGAISADRNSADLLYNVTTNYFEINPNDIDPNDNDNLPDENDSEDDLFYDVPELFEVKLTDYIQEIETRIPIYEGSMLTKKESEVLILAQTLRHGFSDSALDSTLQIINCHLPFDIHGSKYNFLKSFPNPNAITYYYCNSCSTILNFEDSEESTCKNCTTRYVKSILHKNGKYFLYVPLKEQLKQFVKSKYYKFLRKSSDDESDIINGKFYRLLREKKIIGDIDLTIQWNTDGIKTFVSSKPSIWAILVQINELPYRMRKDNMFCCGIWFASEKPPMNLFLLPFSEEMIELHETGFDSETFLDEKPITIKVHTICAPVDSPARCAIQHLKQYNGEFGCGYCLHPGEEIPFGNGHARVYCGDKHKGRTLKQHLADVSTVVESSEITELNGVKGPSVIMQIPIFHIIWSFPPEYLHVVAEGVAELVTDLWFDSKHHEANWYLGKELDEIDKLLLSIKPPTELTRCPQSIKNRCRWKASEWKNFILYFSLVCLRKLKTTKKKKYYQHWFLFVYSINIFSKTKISEVEFSKASEAIRLFVLKFEDLYGKEYMKYNVHLLLHIPQSVKNFGALWAWSTFPYEHYNGVIKKLFKGTQYLPEQIIKSYTRLKYVKLSSSVFSKADSSARGKNLFQTLMKEIKVKRCIEYGEDLRVFGCAQEVQLTDLTKLVITHFIEEEIQSCALSFDRFIIKHILIHTEKYLRLTKRKNCVVKTSDGVFISITNFLCIKTARGESKQVVIGKELQVQKEALCNYENFASFEFSFIVKETKNIIPCWPTMIETKCVYIPHDNQCCVIPLANSLETD